MINCHKNTIFSDLGLLEYKSAWDLQEKVCDSLITARIENRFDEVLHHLFFVEHPHVYTLGLNGNDSNMLMDKEFLNRIGASYFKTNRGGDITYHGPGQIVGYPVLNLEAFARGIREYIFLIEEAVIHCLSHYGIIGERLSGATGVWLESNSDSARKICAIGVRTSRGITMHGFAFNINTDLTYFNHINPCGFTDKGVTSLSLELGTKVNITEVKKILKACFADVFGMQFVK